MNKSVKNTKSISIRNVLLFLTGGICYYAIEVLFRGHSHWTMAVCGGICLTGMYYINKRFSKSAYMLRAFVCTMLITFVEFTTGCLVNLWLNWNIWSYRGQPFNFLGQISLLFCCIWFFLSFLVCVILTFTEKILNKISHKVKS